MAQKLNITQTKLIDLATRHGGIYSIETGSGRTKGGGKVSYGNRERDQMFALEQMGLIKIISRQPTSEMCGNGNMIRGTVFCYKKV